MQGFLLIFYRFCYCILSYVSRGFKVSQQAGGGCPTTLSELSVQLRGKVFDELLHDGIDSLIVEGLAVVLQDEVYGVTLLALWQVFTLIDIEEFYFSV